MSRSGGGEWGGNLYERSLTPSANPTNPPSDRVLPLLPPSTPPAREGPTTLLLFRHAERLDDSEAPPLADTGGKTVVVSQFRRTSRQTARPFADAVGLEVQVRALEVADTPEAARPPVPRGVRRADGARGGSVPAMLGALTGSEPPELEGYGDLFAVTVPRGGAARVIHARVGG